MPRAFKYRVVVPAFFSGVLSSFCRQFAVGTCPLPSPMTSGPLVLRGQTEESVLPPARKKARLPPFLLGLSPVCLSPACFPPTVARLPSVGLQTNQPIHHRRDPPPSSIHQHQQCNQCLGIPVGQWWQWQCRNVPRRARDTLSP